MGNNLPPSVDISDSDAPWNKDYPEPSDINMSCYTCGWSGTFADVDNSNLPYHCPECDSEIK